MRTKMSIIKPVAILIVAVLISGAGFAYYRYNATTSVAQLEPIEEAVSQSEAEGPVSEQAVTLETSSSESAEELPENSQAVEVITSGGTVEEASKPSGSSGSSGSGAGTSTASSTAEFSPEVSSNTVPEGTIGYGPPDAAGNPNSKPSSSSSSSGSSSSGSGGSGMAGANPNATTPAEQFMGKPAPSGTPGNSMLRGNETWSSELGGWVFSRQTGGESIIYPNGAGANLN